MGPDETRIRPPGGSSAAPKVASLVCVAGHADVLGLRIALEGEVVLGREPGSAAPLRSPDVSRRHARVVSAEAGHAVEDLGSTNGTFVNGEEVERRLLRSGDRIDLGGTVFKYLAAGDAEAEEWERLRAEAVRDALTGLPNRRAFEEALLREVARAERENAPFAVLLLDVDHFKRVNDGHGHPAGDAVLRAVAARARGALRAADLLARVGGEELAALLPGADRAAALEAGERVRLAVRASPVEAGNAAITVTLSVGVAVRRAGEEGADLLARGDERLYAAKRGGRDRVEG